MTDEHIYVDESGVAWDRVFMVPQANIKHNIDINNPNDFVEATKNKKGSLGDLCDLSQELSEKRASKSDDGRDKVQDKFFDQWSKKRKGKKHPNDTRIKNKI